jgi:DNA-binding NarL/FixJ family response regulator
MEVLVLSGDPLRRALLGLMLKRRGARVLEAGSVSHAAGLLVSERLDALLLDGPSLDPDEAGRLSRLAAGLAITKLLVIGDPEDRPVPCPALRAPAAGVLGADLDETEIVGALRLLAEPASGGGS